MASLVGAAVFAVLTVQSGMASNKSGIEGGTSQSRSGSCVSLVVVRWGVGVHELDAVSRENYRGVSKVSERL